MRHSHGFIYFVQLNWYYRREEWRVSQSRVVNVRVFVIPMYRIAVHVTTMAPCTAMGGRVAVAFGCGRLALANVVRAGWFDRARMWGFHPVGRGPIASGWDHCSDGDQCVTAVELFVLS